MNKKQPPAATKPLETADAIARDTFREALIAVRDEIRGIRSGKIKPKKHTPTETIAYLGKQAASFAAELRKAEAADHKRTSSLTKALVLEWFRLLEPTDAARFLRELQQLGNRRSGLA